MVDFSKLKRQSGKESLQSLTNELSKLNTYADADPRFWRHTTDKVGNGYAVIRFLPAPDGEDVPFIRQFKHDFKGPTGAVYRELSLTTIGLQDPCGEMNSKLWNTGMESDKELARKRKRKTVFISNIFVINDSGTPENNGKVFLYRYGVKIFDKIQAKMMPEFEQDEGFNPFDFWEGANFKLRVKKVQEFPNYDDSEFAAQSKLFADDDKMEMVWKQQYSLQDFNDPKNFKSYDELKTLLGRVAATESMMAPSTRAPTTKTVESKNEQKELPWDGEGTGPSLSEARKSAENDGMMDYFKKLAAD